MKSTLNKFSYQFILSTIGTLAVLGGFRLNAAQSFEGIVEMTAKSSKNPVTIVYYMKGDKMRTEPKSGLGREGGASILDRSRKKMFVLMAERKQYMEMEFDVNKEAKAAQEPKKNEFLENLKKTGKSEMILGYSAEQWLSKIDEKEIELWTTKGLGAFGGFGGSGHNQSPSAWEKKIGEMGMFPLRFIERSKAGEEKLRWEVTRIDKKTLDASLFEIPAGYQKLEMPKMPAIGAAGKKGGAPDMKQMQEMLKNMQGMKQR